MTVRLQTTRRGRASLRRCVPTGANKVHFARNLLGAIFIPCVAKGTRHSATFLWELGGCNHSKEMGFVAIARSLAGEYASLKVSMRAKAAKMERVLSAAAEGRQMLTARSSRRQQPTCDAVVLETAAQALFEFVFSRTDRFDSKSKWENSDESTKQGFREEAIAVIEAVWPFLISERLFFQENGIPELPKRPDPLPD